MSLAERARTLHWETEPAAAGDIPESFWRPLFFFNVYRLIVALILLVVVTWLG